MTNQFPIHCSITGRPIGLLSETDSEMLLAVVGPKPEGGEALESWQDEVDLRMAAFARPAPAFAVTDESTLIRMAESGPVGFAMTWAYLMNRWQDNKDAKPTDFESRMSMSRQRIANWPAIEARFADHATVVESRMQFILMAIDYAVGLRKLPFTVLASRMLSLPQDPDMLEKMAVQLQRYESDLHQQVAKGKWRAEHNSAVAPLLRKHFWADESATVRKQQSKAVKPMSESAKAFALLMQEALQAVSPTPAVPVAPAAPVAAPTPIIRRTLSLSAFKKVSES